MNRFLSFLAFGVLASACTPSPEFEFEARSPSLSVNVTTTDFDKDWRDGYSKISATAVITNTSSEPQNYSNQWLWLLSGDVIQERAYLDSLASHAIDVDVVMIESGESLNLEIYWAVPDDDFERIGNEPFVLELRSIKD